MGGYGPRYEVGGMEMVRCVNKRYWHKVLQCECIAVGKNRDGAIRLETPYGTIYSYPHDLKELNTNAIQKPILE